LENEIQIDEKIEADPLILADVSHSGRMRQPQLESQSSSNSSGSLKYLCLDYLMQCGFQSLDVVSNSPTGKSLGNDVEVTIGTEESNSRFQSQPELKAQIEDEDDVLDRENHKDCFRKKRICITFTSSAFDI